MLRRGAPAKLTALSAGYGCAAAGILPDAAVLVECGRTMVRVVVRAGGW